MCEWIDMYMWCVHALRVGCVVAGWGVLQAWTASRRGLCPHPLQETGGDHPLAAEAEETFRGEQHHLLHITLSPSTAVVSPQCYVLTYVYLYSIRTCVCRTYVCIRIGQCVEHWRGAGLGVPSAPAVHREDLCGGARGQWRGELPLQPKGQCYLLVTRVCGCVGVCVCGVCVCVVCVCVVCGVCVVCVCARVCTVPNKVTPHLSCLNTELL